jgi:hypothetical protein
MDIIIFHKFDYHTLKGFMLKNISCLFYLSAIMILFHQKNYINMYSFKLIMNVLIQCLCHAHYVSLVRHCILPVVFIWLQGYIMWHIGIVGGGVQLGPLSTAATNGLLCQPQGIMMMEKLVESLPGETEVLGENLP